MTVHRWFAAKACPGDYLYNLHGQIASEVNARLGNVVIVTPEKDKSDSYTAEQFIRDVQSVTGSEVDGIAGPETISNTPTLSSKLNSEHAAVKFVQKRLAALGYVEVGSVDGIAGPKFTSAVAHFQMDNDCVVDGEITARCKTWQKLLGMA
jgi:peptidoglycan hydrolase-like protein with peptidoglycan-binding domain